LGTEKIDSGGKLFLFQFLEPSREKTALRYLTRPGERLLECEETLPVSNCNFRGTNRFSYVGHLAVALGQIRINVSVFVCVLNCEE